VKLLKTLILLALLAASCASVKIPEKIAPEFKGVDAKVLPYYNEYLRLAKKQGIMFLMGASVGIKDINVGRVIGVCHYGAGWREVDLDRYFLEKSENTQKEALVFHELTHCLCTRIGHDYGPDKHYKESDDALGGAKEPIMCAAPKEETGYYSDGCPITIMYPEVLSKECMDQHYDDYVKEMFVNCNPW